MPFVIPQAIATRESFWRHLYAALAESGTIQAFLPSDDSAVSQVEAFLKMHGFTSIQFSNSSYDKGSKAVIATKVAFKPGGTSLKNRKKKAPAASEEAANPWANLGNDAADNNQINEDSLMADESKV